MGPTLPARLTVQSLLKCPLLRKAVPKHCLILLHHSFIYLVSISCWQFMGSEGRKLYSLPCSQHLAHSRCSINMIK